MDIQKKIFGNTSLSDLMNEVHVNARIKNRKIDDMIDSISGKIKTINDAIVIAPIIKEYLDVAIKNDQHLLKLADIVNKVIATESKMNSSSGGDVPEFELSDEEKQQLIAEMDQALEEAQETLRRPLPDNNKK